MFSSEVRALSPMRSWIESLMIHTRDSYKINIVGIDSSKDISMREVYGLNPAEAQ